MKKFWSKLWARRGLKFSVFTFLILALTGLVWGSTYFSKSAFLDRYLKERTQADMTFEDIKPYLVWADTKELITMEEAKYSTFKPLPESENQEATKEALLVADDKDAYYVTSVGTRFWFFPDYRLAVKPISLTLRTNLNQVDILLNDKMVARSDSTDYKTVVERLPMADYDASIKGTYEGNEFFIKRSFDGSNPQIDLSVNFKTFKVTSNLEGGTLYLGDKELGKITKGHYALKNYPLADPADIFVKKTFSDGELETKKVAIDSIEENQEVALNIEGLLTKEEASELAIAAFSQAWVYGTYGGDPATEELAKIFQDNSTNDFYKTLKDSVSTKLLMDNRRASSLNITNIHLTNFTQVGKETYALDYSALYDFFYDKSTDPQGRTQGSLYQTVGGRALVTKKNGKFLFDKAGHSALTVISEDNQVKKLLPVPEEWVGTWIGSLDAGKTKVKMTVTADGKVTTTLETTETSKPDSKTNSNSKSNANSSSSAETNNSQKETSSKKKETKTSTVTDYEEVSPGLYRFETANPQALAPGANLGGVGVKYAHGVEIAGSSLKIVVWQTGANEDFENAKAMYGLSMTKE